MNHNPSSPDAASSSTIAGKTGTKSRPAASFSLNSVLTAAGETAYHWDLLSDRMIWAPNAPQVLGINDISLLRTGAGFQSLIRKGLVKGRREALLSTGLPTGQQGGSSGGSGCEPGERLFSIQYALDNRHDNGGDGLLWLEDHGRWRCDGQEPVAASGVIRIINERYAHERHLDFLSRHDQLTGQFNRAELWENISDALMSGESGERSHALLIAGIKNMSMINEAFGFDTGDEVIAAIARRLREQLREDDVIGRFSSNKFGILLADAGEQAMAAAAERLLRSVRNEVIDTSHGPVAAAISIGGVLLPAHAATVSLAIGHALAALSRAKAAPHDIFIAHDPSEKREEICQRNRHMADELVRAIRDKRLALALQPIVRADNLETEIYECLLRIRKEDGELVSGGEYVPVAEQLGLIRLVDFKVLELAIEVARARPELNLTINVSGLTASDSSWLELLASLINGDTSLAGRLIIEITETAALLDLEESINFVSRVKQLGCKVAVDDFGAGYNSFRNLQTLRPDMIKIDGSFVENMAESQDDQFFVSMLAGIAKRFGLEIVAECVGDEQTTAMLREAGITYLQGYHFGKPFLAMAESGQNEDDTSLSVS